MKDLQEIINKKAEERAREEVRKIVNAINNNSRIKDYLGKIYTIVQEKKENVQEKRESIRDAFWSVDSSLSKQIVDYLKEIYIPEESKNFIDKVNSLSEQIDELKEYNYDNRH